MNPIVFVLRHPITILMMIVSIVLGGLLGLSRMPIDIFPTLDVPTIYVVCNYGGMDAGQMEGLITNVFEVHFQYVDGVKTIESRNIQNATMIKISFYPGTDMSAAMAQTVAYSNRAQAQMPPGVLPPMIMAFGAGDVPIGYVVLSSQTRTLGQMQDLMFYRIRPLFAAEIPGTISTPPFGANVRAIVVSVDPDRLHALKLTPDDVIAALSAGNLVSPSGNLYIKDQMPIASVNAMVVDPKELENIPLKLGRNVYLRDVAKVVDSTDVPCGYGLVNGEKSVYMPVIKRATASTLTVVAAVRAALPKMRDVLPDDIEVRFDFDESPTVRQSIQTVATEGFLGASLTGLMVLLFLRDWRSALVVVVNIPCALLGALIGLWIAGETINIMTLGGLALAIGILVDESTVFIENVHSQMSRTSSVARAVRRAYSDTVVPRMLAMFCVLSVFLPAFVMQGPVRSLFMPLTLAVGFSMITSFTLSSTLVPVLSIWILRLKQHAHEESSKEGFSFATVEHVYAGLLRKLLVLRYPLVLTYLVGAGLILWQVGRRVGTDMFPLDDAGQFKMRISAPDGTHFDLTRAIVVKTLEEIEAEAGKENIAVSLGYAGSLPPMYAINSIILFMRGPGDGMLRVAMKKDSGVDIEALKERLRKRLPEQVIPWLAQRMQIMGTDPAVAAQRAKKLTFGFEPGDIVGQVMSLGSPTPIEVVSSSNSLSDARRHAERIQAELSKIPALRDLQFAQSLAYPTVQMNIDRQKAGLSGVTAADVSRSMVAATSSSRYVVQNYWKDPKSGSDYQVQVEIPPQRMDSATQAATVPVNPTDDDSLLVRDVADVFSTSEPGEYDRYNMQRYVSLTANIYASDLGSVAKEIHAAIARAGEPPRGVSVQIRGQIGPMEEMFEGLTIGLAMAVVVILIMLTAYFQSFRLAVVSVSTLPAVLSGVALALWLTRTTLNIESFMGAIMSIGVATANSIMLVTFANRNRLEGVALLDAAVEGAASRLRPILMTSCAMIVGMLPMALALEEGGKTSAPLGRAVIGGLFASTLAALLLLPSIFSVVLRSNPMESPSLDPDDPISMHYDAQGAQLEQPSPPGEYSE